MGCVAAPARRGMVSMRRRRPELLAASSGVALFAVMAYVVAGAAWAVTAGVFGVLAAAALLYDDD